MLLTNEHGTRPSTPEEAEQLEGAGYQKCYNGKCDFYVSPEAQAEVQDHPDQGYYTCPKCQRSYDMMSHLPWHGAPEEGGNFEYAMPYNPERGFGYEPGGGTRIGLNMEEQAQIGEDLVKEHGLPGYGPLIWWHEGGAGAHSPLDGTTKDWGVEVKTIGFDATHHRFVPGSPAERGDKNAAASEMKLQGVLGVLVMLNYRTSCIPYQHGAATCRGSTVQEPIHGPTQWRTNPGFAPSPRGRSTVLEYNY